MKKLFLLLMITGCQVENIEPATQITGRYIETVENLEYWQENYPADNQIIRPATWIIITKDSIFRENQYGVRDYGGGRTLSSGLIYARLVAIGSNLDGWAVPCYDDPLGVTVFPDMEFKMIFDWDSETGELTGVTRYDTGDPIVPTECTEDGWDSPRWESKFTKIF